MTKILLAMAVAAGAGFVVGTEIQSQFYDAERCAPQVDRAANVWQPTWIDGVVPAAGAVVECVWTGERLLCREHHMGVGI